MDNVEKSNWKIWAALLIVIFLILLGMILFSKNSTQLLPKNPQPTSQSTINTGNTNSKSWKSVKETDFSISYPENVSIEKATVAGGGRSLIFRPKDDLVYNLELQIIPSEIASFDQTVRTLRALKYIESSTQVDGKPAKKFIGSLDAGSISTQKIAVVFEENGEVYKLQLSYNALERNKEIDKLFDSIIETFSVN